MDTGFYCPATLAARHGLIMSLPPPVVTARPHGFAAWRLAPGGFTVRGAGRPGEERDGSPLAMRVGACLGGGGGIAAWRWEPGSSAAAAP